MVLRHVSAFTLPSGVKPIDIAISSRILAIRSFHQSPICRQEHDTATLEPGKTYYDILGLPLDATLADVKRKFYELSKLHHPDRNPNDPSAQDRFVRINDAYHVLGTPSKRSSYDRSLHAYQGRRHHGFSFGGHTGPAGGRPASGLSRRRTTPQGPPPSYYRNQNFGAGRTARTSSAGRTYADEGGIGIGYQASSRTDDVPHFNWDEKYRQHHDYEQRQRRAAWTAAAARASGADEAGKTVSNADMWFQAAMIGGCVLLVGALGGWLASFRGSGRRKDAK